MTTWTLIILTALIGEFYQSVGTYSASSVQGFTTEQACVNASKKIFDSRLLPVHEHSKPIMKMTCVAMSL